CKFYFTGCVLRGKLREALIFSMPVSSSSAVNVYVRVHRNSPYLVCMDLPLSQSEVIDPNYLWIGPNGQNLKRKQYVNLTETGKLMLVGFKEHMSGSYMCTLSYRVFRNDMQAEEERFKTYKFMIYAYREPDYTYRISVHFTTKECKLAANKRFFEELQKILNNLVANLKCHIIDSSYRCFSVKRPKHGLVDELFIVFQGNVKVILFLHHSFYCTWTTYVELDWLIEKFFREQWYILKHEFVNIPAIHYIDHSFQVTRLDSCRPGFGKNDFIHNDCANCCGIYFIHVLIFSRTLI
uniref:Zona pellucida binding protein 2 n=1 Tax=Pseudonaja textilis TaxID=8673 RepID=A0A670YLV5_PSETE